MNNSIQKTHFPNDQLKESSPIAIDKPSTPRGSLTFRTFKKILGLTAQPNKSPLEILFENAQTEHINTLKIQAQTRAQDYLNDLSYIVRFQQYFGTTLSSTLKIDKQGAFLSGAGSSFFSSVHEIQLLSKFIKKTHLASEEKKICENYLKDLEQSYDLNKMIHFLEGKEVSVDHYTCANLIFEKIIQLKLEDSVHLDIGMCYHAMRLQVKRLQDHFQFVLYDTSGELEFASHRSFETTRNLLFARKGPTTLSFQVAIEKFKTEGNAYFRKLLEYNSKEHFDKTKKSILEKISFLNAFKALGNKFNLSNMQTTQKALNCPTQRLRPAQKLNFGSKLYYKFRKFTHEQIKKEYKKMARLIISEKEVKALEMQTLSKKELKQARSFFLRLEDPPTEKEGWSLLFRLLNHNITRYGSLISS